MIWVRLEISQENAADPINEIFANVGKNLAAKIDPVIDFQAPVIEALADILTFNDISLAELMRELLLIIEKKSSGIEHVAAKVLKEFLIGRKDEFLFILNWAIASSTFQYLSMEGSKNIPNTQ